MWHKNYYSIGNATLNSIISNTHTINGTKWSIYGEVPLRNYSLTHSLTDSLFLNTMTAET